MSEHGRSPRERAIPLAQWASIGHGPTPTSAARRARAASLRAVLPPERKSARAVAFFYLRTCATKLLVGGRSWHVRARPCTEGEGRLAGAVGFHRAWVDSNQRSAARALRKRACCASSRERERARAVALFYLRTCATKLLVGGRGWLGCQSTAVHRGKRAIRLEQSASIGHGPTPISAARRARAASARAALPPERESACAVAFFYLRTCVTKLLVGGRGWHVRSRPCTEGEGRLAGAVGFHRACAESNQCGAARTRCKRTCCASSRERGSGRSGAFLLFAHAQLSCSLEAAAGMSEHGRSLRERAVSLAQWGSIGHGSLPTSASGRTRAASARAVLPPERESARAMAFFFLRTCASKPLVGGRG